MDEPMTAFEKLSNDELNLLKGLDKLSEFAILKKLIQDDVDKAKESAITDSPVTLEGNIDYGFLTRSGQRLNLYFVLKKVLNYPNRAKEELDRRKKELTMK